MKTEINIGTNIITWAIDRAGYDLMDFSLKFPKVKDWLDEKKKPTIKQLEAFSRKVHLPFGYLFLKEPPIENLPIPFYRTFNTQETKVSINVYDTILLIQQRQDWLREYLKDNEIEPLSFVGKYRNRQNYIEIVEDIRKILNLNNEWASTFQRWEDTLEHLTKKIEEIGIILNYNGVVGNNTTRPIKVDDCRGFVLVDEMAPFMFINSADSKAAQLFTIVHELAHIWIGHSAGFDFRQLQPSNDPVELLCDKIAAEFLVPKDSFNRIWQGNQKDIRLVARYFKVSEIVVARRALDLGKINKTEFFNFYNNYISQLHLKKENQSSRGDFYATTKKRLSLKFASHINQAVKSNNLLYRDAYKLTGLRGNTYQTFFNKHFLN
jgi:Zn-dependent peptidase ImmA (M78 family)